MSRRKLIRRSSSKRSAGPSGGQSERGTSLLEVLVSMALMSALAGTMSILFGAAVRSKLIIATRSADTETARQTLAWMAERLRNAGLNVQPSTQAYEPRCQDMVVAQEATMQPTASRVYVSGEITNTDEIAGNELITLGYSVANDPDTGLPVVMEFRQACGGGTAEIRPLSNPQVSVTGLVFNYYDSSGLEVTALTDPAQIRRIRAIIISLTVEATQGSSGTQSQTWTRLVMLRNPEPNLNNYMDLNETY